MNYYARYWIKAISVSPQTINCKICIWIGHASDVIAALQSDIVNEGDKDICYAYRMLWWTVSELLCMLNEKYYPKSCLYLHIWKSPYFLHLRQLNVS